MGALDGEKTVAWVVQTNVEDGSPSPTLLRDACTRLLLPFHGVAVTAGANTLPPFAVVDGPVVFHGRATLIRCALNEPRWAHGVFFSEQLFTHDAYVAGYGQDMLNASARTTTIDALTAVGFDPHARVFIRPHDDSKRFTGHVTTIAQFLVAIGVDSGASSVRVVVTEAREIDAEWRLFIVEGRVVSGSMYRPTAERALPPELIHFAELAAHRWSPAPVFVMDVARVDRTWKIVECNCFNGSRFYDSDVVAIVAAVSRFQARRIS